MALRIVIVGGVAGGMSAATRARRMNEAASIIVLEKGGYISFANCGLPYYLAGRIQTEDKLLVTTVDRVKERFNIDARVRNEVVAINRADRTMEVLDHRSSTKYLLGYDKLILATGASAIVPPIEHGRAPNVFLVRSMEDTQAIHNFLKLSKPKSMAIVGAGFIGLEMAEAMRDRGLDVCMIEKAPHVLPPLDQELCPRVQQELIAHGVQVITGTGLEALRANNGNVNEIVLADGRAIKVDFVVLSIGVKPNVQLAQSAGLCIGPTGGIAVDAYQRTSDPDIYAAGDVAELIHGVTGKPARVPLAGPANRQGRLAGEHAATGSSRPAGKVMGTAIVQVFDLSVGVTGLGERDARKAGFDIDTAYVMPNNHAGYYPGAEPMRLKLIFGRQSRRILGAQAVGGAGVDKRIDVIATVMHFGGTIDDLAEVDLAYAPQFGSAKDPVHFAAFVARNQQHAEAISPAEMNGQQLIDVRTPAEYAKGTIKSAVNIPLDELRGRVDEIDMLRETVVFCQVGQRGYVAQRILQQSGVISVKNLKGGYSLAKDAQLA